MTENEYVQFSVKRDTRRKFKIAAVKADLSYDEYLKYLLNLGSAYPPNQTTKKASNG